MYAGAIGKQIPDISLSIGDYYIICNMLKDVRSGKLDFLIETPGGSAEAAEEIVRFIKDNFGYNVFVVSGEAKSAGTVLVLSGDDIIMTSSGSLGPIDAQVRIERSVISAFDYIEWVNEKREEAEKIGKLNPFDAIMVAQTSPGELKRVHYALKFAEDLVVEWLMKYKFKNWNHTETRNVPVTEKMKRERAEEVVRELINHAQWRTHGRSIKMDDLERIGLKITKLNDNSKLAEIIYKIQTICHLYFASTTTYKIFAMGKEKLFKQTILSGAPPKIPAGKTPDVAEAGLTCPSCGKKHKIYAKLKSDPKIDENFRDKDVKPFHRDNKLICNCGFEIDLTGLRNEIEAKSRKKSYNLSRRDENGRAKGKNKKRGGDIDSFFKKN